MRSAFIGIDVAFAKRKHLPVVICTWEEGRLIPQPLRRLELTPPRGEGNVVSLDEDAVRHFARRASAYVVGACHALGLEPMRIGIDAPSAPCAHSIRRRAAEQAMDAARISCFATPSAEAFAAIKVKVELHLSSGGTVARIPHSNQLWMLVGFALYEELSQVAPCLEVFPHATARAIGASAIHKSKAGAVEAQLAAAARYTGWPTGRVGEPRLSEIAWGTPHDQLDAYLSAWVAALEESDRVAHGQPPSDAIWVPRVTGDEGDSAQMEVSVRPTRRTPRERRAAAPVRPSGPSVAPLLCPGCGRHEFRRWPWGWDAHAAHACEALSATEPIERKAEYRRRFAAYFRR